MGVNSYTLVNTRAGRMFCFQTYLINTTRIQMSQAVPVRVEEGGAPPRTTRATRIFARPSSSPAHRPRTGDVLPVTRYNIPHFDFQRAHRHDMRAEKDPRDNNTPHALRDTPQPHTVDRSMKKSEV